LPVQLYASVAVTVKLALPSAVAVPLISPAVESVSPAGSEPEDTAKVYGPVPPLALTVWLYASVVFAPGSAPAAGESVMVGQLMTIEYDATPVQPLCVSVAL